MQSRNVQVPGDFSLGETVRSKKAQNKTKQSKTKNFIFAFDYTDRNDLNLEDVLSHLICFKRSPPP